MRLLTKIYFKKKKEAKQDKTMWCDVKYADFFFIVNMNLLDNNFGVYPTSEATRNAKQCNNNNYKFDNKYCAILWIFFLPFSYFAFHQMVYWLLSQLKTR